MQVNDVGLERSQRARESHRSRNVSSPSMPSNCPNIYVRSAQQVTDWTIVAQEQHGKPVTTPIQELSEIERGESNTSCVLRPRAKHMDDVGWLQVLTTVRILSSTLRP